jgi:glycosyltransferase involved in cell wall biosynthesis
VTRVNKTRRGAGTVLIAHPSADLYGSDRVMLETVDALVAAGRRVVVTLPADGPLVQLIEARGARVELCLSPVLRKSALRPVGMVRLLLETARSLPASISLIRRSGAAVVLVNTVTIPFWIPVARLVRRPVICHVHEAEASASSVIKRALALPLLLANKLIVNSRFSLGVLTSSFARLGRKATVVLNAVAGPEQPTLAREGLDGVVRLLYIGRLSPRKGPDVAIEAVNVLRTRGVRASLDLVGAPFPGYEWFEQDLRDLVRRKDLGGAVTFHGFQSDVWPHLLSADVVVVPSVKDEPFGNTAVESVLSARPVVVSATSGLQEAVEGYGSAQQVRPADPDALADAIGRVHDDWPTFREKAFQDAHTAAERHAPAEYARRVCEIVDSVQ